MSIVVIGTSFVDIKGFPEAYTFPPDEMREEWSIYTEV